MFAKIIQRPIGVNFIALTFVVFGIMAFFRLPQNLMPEVKPPTIVVHIEKPGASEREIENEIIDTLEDHFSTITGLMYSESYSRPEKAEVLLHFKADIDVDKTVNKLREKLAHLTLRHGTLPPKVLSIDPNTEPVLRFVVQAQNKNNELVNISENFRDELLTRLEGLPEVASVRLRGQKKMMLEIIPDDIKLLNYGIEASELEVLIRDATRKSNIGRVDTNEGERTLQILGSAIRPADIPNLIVRKGIHLKDLASIELKIEDPEEMVLYRNMDHSFSGEALLLEIMAHRDVGMVPLSDAVKQLLDHLSDSNDGHWSLFGGKLMLISDASEPVKETIDEVGLSVIIGAGLALLVLFLFMHSFRASLIVFISVPLSVIICFLFMDQAGVGLNLMSLSGLALGIGMLVDNAIVVLESVQRKIDEGQTLINATVRGASEVIPAVIASTLTTVAVFLPLTFLEGYQGDLLFDQAFTVSMSLFISLIVAIILVPTLMALPSMVNLKNKSLNEEKKENKNEGAYDKMMLALIKRPIMVIMLLILLISIIFSCIQVLPKRNMPPVPIERLKAEIRLDSTYDVRKSYAWLQNFLNHYKLSEYDFQIMAISGEALQYAQVYGKREDHELEVSIEFSQPIFDKKKLRNWMSRFEQSLYSAGAINANIYEVPTMDLAIGNRGVDLEIVFNGEDRAFLKELESEAVTMLRDKGVMGIRFYSSNQKKEILIKPDSVKLNDRKISMQEFVLRLSNAFEEHKIEGFFPEYQKSISSSMLPILIKGVLLDKSLSKIGNLNVGTSLTPILLKDVAEITFSFGDRHIYHYNGQPVFRIQGNHLPQELSINDIEDWFQSKLKNYRGYEVQVKRGERIQSDQLSNLMKMFALSVFLIVVIMAVQFESILQPILVIFSIPMALAGSFLLLWVTSNGIDIMSGIGIVILIGVAVNNAIVLVSTVNQRIQNGNSIQEAVILASRTRLRPILMTALTTISGLSPLLLGSSSSSALKEPLAIAVIGGLFSSTLLVLLILPSMIYLCMAQKKPSQ